VAAEPRQARLCRDARPRAALLEYHRQAAAGQRREIARPATRRAAQHALQTSCQVQQRLELGGRQGEQRVQVAALQARDVHVLRSGAGDAAAAARRETVTKTGEEVRGAQRQARASQ
jgi:hypothetical protein